MKKTVIVFIIGFIAGISYIVACGNSNSGQAGDTMDALKVLYSNAASIFTGTNVQAVLDETSANQSATNESVAALQASVAALEVLNLTLTNADVVGSWSCGKGIYTFNENGTGVMTDGDEYPITYVVSGSRVLVEIPAFEATAILSFFKVNNVLNADLASTLCQKMVN